MSNIKKWKQIKKSGAFRRRLKMCYENMMCSKKIGVDNDNRVQLNKTMEFTKCLSAPDQTLRRRRNNNYYIAPLFRLCFTR